MHAGCGARKEEARVNVCPATGADLPAIRRLLGFEHLPTDDVTEELLNNFLVLRQGELVLGAVGLECYGEVGLLRSLVVGEETRRRGRGAELVAAAESLAKKVGVESIYLLTTTAESFFASLGYRRLHRDEAPAQIRATMQFRALCPAAAVLMVKP
jgi:amino-acid N-acetyltransferase